MKYTHTIIEHDATEAEWASLRKQLGVLTEQQIKQIATLIGLQFVAPGATKDDYIDILDEAFWDELTQAYKVVVGKQLTT